MERSRAGSQVEHDLDGLGLSRAGGGVKAVGDAALAEAEAVRDHGQHVHALVLQQAQAQRVLRTQRFNTVSCETLDCDATQSANCAGQTPMTADKSRIVGQQHGLIQPRQHSRVLPSECKTYNK